MRCLWKKSVTAVCFLFPFKSLILSRKDRFPILIARIGLIPKAMALLCDITKGTLNYSVDNFLKQVELAICGRAKVSSQTWSGGATAFS